MSGVNFNDTTNLAANAASGPFANGGNTVAATMTLGTVNNFGLDFIINSIAAGGIDTNQMWSTGDGGMYLNSLMRVRTITVSTNYSIL